MSSSAHEQHDGNFVDKRNVQDVVLDVTHPSACSEAVRVLPYPQNEDLVHRPNLTDKLDKLLPQTSGSSSAAMWGLGGSGKTQIALDYAYRRCNADDECSIFWVRADSEANFLTDYKTIGKKLNVDQRLEGTDLLNAVRDEIEARSKWLMILDNADDLRLFGVHHKPRANETNGCQSQDLHVYVPYAAQGTVLWTSRDEQILGPLVKECRGINVEYMAMDEATTLLARTGGISLARGEALGEAGVNALLEQLQCLPLAILQAGTYMRRMLMTTEQYLSLLRQGKPQWEVLQAGDAEQHGCPEVPSSVLETCRISMERIRVENELSYRMLHVITYVDSQDIPQDLLAVASDRCEGDTVDNLDSKVSQRSTAPVFELEILAAVARLKDFAFLSLHGNDSGRRYKMHKLVQEAIRHGLRVRDSAVSIITKPPRENNGAKEDGHFFPSSGPATWMKREQCLGHASRAGERMQVSAAEVETAHLLQRVSDFLCKRGRWREKEFVDSRVLSLRQAVLGDKHPHTIDSMASLATTYHEQSRYAEAEALYQQVLKNQVEVFGEKHPHTIKTMVDLTKIYYAQGRYGDDEELSVRVLELQREVSGERHPNTIKSMVNLATTYHAQGRYSNDEELLLRVLKLQQEVLGERHPDTIESMVYLATTYRIQGRYNEAEKLHL
ncbi:hypothetical protein FPRO05_14247 [Fusarium proliferatum]|uniref:Uncharacterized protein n=1 Tax=Gibberella intermedia TaxID=948311 RepID=A0A365MTE9_GIBIN|nr:hypothetical protein FPRO05_14247 [Fusarium proliferatum]